MKLSPSNCQMKKSGMPGCRLQPKAIFASLKSIPWAVFRSTTRDWLIRAQMIQHPVVRGGDALAMRFFKSDTEMFEPAYLGDGPESASAARREPDKPCLGAWPKAT
ncbi:hypothetical protein [Paracoccus sp. NBH48]|uniref:hypothetical protein n=1 Tax=Paracoccus sp. NBH48 TaxID=2596918 RepID=UPI001890D5CD|nr:hypothetical protein [Paracoccus sp. NBH48]